MHQQRLMNYDEFQSAAKIALCLPQQLCLLSVNLTEITSGT
jgi:hypothetical protein